MKGALASCPFCKSEWVVRKKSGDPVQCPRCKRVLPVPRTENVSGGEVRDSGFSISSSPTIVCSECHGLNGLHRKGCRG